ncbi:semenogelin-1-like [Armigeres subalbatus]|uniref:semenogelin-1-like n=1 Tax=Armigeres subalbatus TaxID=124917 RepID=UPI002ED4FF08
MDTRNKTCLFCLKPRQILVDNPTTAKAITEIYNVELPHDGCRICIECHFNVARVQEFKRTIENAADFDVDSCFVCKSESTVNESGVDRVVDYLIKQCTTIDFGKTDTIKACVTCLHVLETSIKCEKMAKNYASAQRFCKQYSTLKECNVALWKINLDALGEICDDGGGGSSVLKNNKNKKSSKRARSSCGEDEGPSKKSKLEDESVLPVMLTKLTPTGPKKTSPPSLKGKTVKQNDKIFIKLPLFTRPKNKKPRKKFGPPHSPSRTIPASPSVKELNQIFSVDLRPLNIRIEHIDLSSYMNKTIAHDTANRQLRKPKNEEFIGLDEEDVVELQNCSMNSSICKRKSILITERTESPNSAKKTVKFSDSPSIKYVDKLEFTDDENGSKDKSDDDEDFEVKKSKKRGTKPQNGTSTPENGKPHAKGPSKNAENGEGGESEETDQAVESGKEENSEKTTEESQKVVSEDDIKGETESNQKESKSEKEEAVTEDATDEKSDAAQKKGVPEENGETKDQPNDVQKEESLTTEKDTPSPLAPTTSAMEIENADSPEAMKIDQSEQPAIDAEMKAVDSPEDVEMTETKSPPLEDVEMKEIGSTSPEPAKSNEEATSSNDTPSEPTEKADCITESKENDNTKDKDSLAAEFEVSDKEEEEMENLKQSLSNILGEEISDSEQGVSQDAQEAKTSNSAADEEHGKSDSIAPSEHEAIEEAPKSETPNNADRQSPSPESDIKLASNESPEKKNQSFASLEDVDDISDDDDILDRLDDADEPTDGRRRSPDLPPLGEDSL